MNRGQGKGWPSGPLWYEAESLAPGKLGVGCPISSRDYHRYATDLEQDDLSPAAAWTHVVRPTT